MAHVEGRINFTKLRGFPILDDNSKIQAQYFIDGAKEVVLLIEQSGTLFSSVVYDMNGNIEGLQQRLETLKIKNNTYVGLSNVSKLYVYHDNVL